MYLKWRTDGRVVNQNFFGLAAELSKKWGSTRALCHNIT